MLPIPETAKPHEVAILMLYEELKTVRRVQEALHYQSPQPVYKVIRRYEKTVTYETMN